MFSDLTYENIHGLNDISPISFDKFLSESNSNYDSCIKELLLIRECTVSLRLLNESVSESLEKAKIRAKQFYEKIKRLVVGFINGILNKMGRDYGINDTYRDILTKQEAYKAVMGNNISEIKKRKSRFHENVIKGFNGLDLLNPKPEKMMNAIDKNLDKLSSIISSNNSVELSKLDIQVVRQDIIKEFSGSENKDTLTGAMIDYYLGKKDTHYDVDQVIETLDKFVRSMPKTSPMPGLLNLYKTDIFKKLDKLDKSVNGMNDIKDINRAVSLTQGLISIVTESINGFISMYHSILTYDINNYIGAVIMRG